MSARNRLFLLAAACSTVAAFANPTDIHPIVLSGDTNPRAVSGNGLTVVGTDTSTGGFRAFRIVGGTHSLLNLDASGSFSEAAAASQDGLVIVGHTDISGVIHAAIWNGVSLTTLPLGAYAEMRATGVSADGLTVVGFMVDVNGRTDAFYRDSLNFVSLASLSGLLHTKATGVSGDGSLIVGYGDVTGGAIHAFTYANQTLLDATEWMRSLNGPGSLSAMSINLSNLPLEGAHHRPLMSYDGMGKQRQFWATGDFGASSRQTDRRTSYGEVGASQAYGDTVVGVAAGTALQTQDLLFGGDAKITGQTFMAEIDTRLADKESILSLLVLRGEWDAQTARGYVTGGGNDISRGQTDMDTTTVRVRYDGPTQKFTGNFTAAPYASFALTRVNTDGFAESGGSFPATFDAHSHTAKESRLGLLTKFTAGPATTIRVTAEWIHRFDDAGDALSGVNQTTSGAFSVAGLAPTKDQARFGLDVDHKLSADTMLSLSIHAAGYGQAHDVAGSLSLRRGF